MQTVSTGEPERRWVRLAVARDGETAERWALALEAAGIEAEVRIDDAVALTKGSSFWPTAGPGGHQLFAYPVYVPAGHRERAASVLVDQGWDGRFGQQIPGGGPDAASMLRGALLATLAGGALVLLLLWRGA